MGLLALQGAHDQIASAQERIKGLRGSLLQAVQAATLPGAGIIMTPALAQLLQQTQRVRFGHFIAQIAQSQCAACFRLCSFTDFMR